jgi:asparagine synthase (glutamine-hydrolysing)
MCGIVGVYGGNTGNIEKACSVIKHRGPDDKGIFIDDKLNIGLGHQRLSILDVSHLGHQPMMSQNKNIVIVFNGEIYNFVELRSALEKEGYVFNGESDTEVLINLYLSDGMEMLSKLKGIFAFAILDKNKETLFVARDALGVKPLYFSTDGDAFYFASEMKALFEFDSIDKNLDIESLNQYLCFLWCPGEGTPIKSINKLLPGQALLVNKGKVKKKWTWYQLPIFIGNSKDLNKNESISGVTNLLRRAVHNQMISDVPLGAFLSGGLDSSSIVAFAREKDPDIKCFTIETQGKQEDGFVDDLPYAKKVAKHLNVNLEIVTVSSNQIADDLQSMIAQLDEPLADPASLNVRYISKLAKKNGIKVLLSGAGGDDLFTGYRRHYALELERYWSWMPRSARELIEDASKKLNNNKPSQRRLKKLFNGAGLSNDERLINYFRWTDDKTLKSLFSLEFRDLIGRSNPLSTMSNFISPISSNTSRLDQMLTLEQRFFLADHNLNYTDKMSMAEGVEARVPFLDLDLIEFVSRIPNKFKQKGNQGKWVLKKAMEPLLPKNIIYRPKTGFGVPLRTWLKEDLKELIGDLLSVESLNRRGLFSVQSVQQLISDNYNGKIDASYTLLSLLCIEIWCREYIDK